MIPNPTQKLTQLEDLIPETNVVATIRQDVATIAKQNNLEFQESYDDLDFLVFAILPLSLTSRVALVSHKNSPIPGIEICVRYDIQNIGEVIAQALKILNLIIDDLAWIDPQYERDFFTSINPIKLQPSTSNTKVKYNS
jgi:hypothetical protein